MIIIFSGTPGTGKTTISKKLVDFLKNKKKENVMYYDHEKIIDEFPSFFISYDKENQTKIVDETKLDEFFEKINSKDKIIVFDSHISQELSSKIVDLCFVLTCDISILKKRLEKRSYSSKKIRDNLDAEIFQVCYNDALDNGLKPILIDCSKNIDECFDIVLKEFENLI